MIIEVLEMDGSFKDMYSVDGIVKVEASGATTTNITLSGLTAVKAIQVSLADFREIMRNFANVRADDGYGFITITETS